MKGKTVTPKSIGRTLGLASAAITMSICISAPANAYLMEVVDVYGDFDGATLRYDFSGLPAAAGDGTLRLRTGISRTSPGVFDGLDLDEEDEFFTLFVDGTSAGNYACNESEFVAALPGNSGGLDCDFDVTFSFASDFGLDLPSLVADGSLLVLAAFSPDVSFSSEQDELFATLSYEEASNPGGGGGGNGSQRVPAPATLMLLGLGLAGVGFSRKKKS